MRIRVICLSKYFNTRPAKFVIFGTYVSVPIATILVDYAVIVEYGLVIAPSAVNI